MPTYTRTDGRKPDELRPVNVTPGFQIHPLGSVLIQCGDTRVICAANVSTTLPRWMRDQNVSGGWITAEYQMLPSATADRGQRESTRGQPTGRTQEIQRLIGRALRTAIDLDKLGPRMIQVDCDVLDADGGTRCAAITGAFLALEAALRHLFVNGDISAWPVVRRIAAVSVGIVDGCPLLDLEYAEDAAAEVDMNVVMTDDGNFVEIQGTAEGQPFTKGQMNAMLALAQQGIGQLLNIRDEVQQ